MFVVLNIYIAIFIWHYLFMGKAGNALNPVLETYGISQNKLAVTMGIGRSTVHYWVNGTGDPLAETLIEIIKALRQLNEVAAEDFVNLYLERQPEERDR